MPVKTPHDRGDFEIALICALPLEAECVQEAFDKFWEDEGKKYAKAPGDPNVYTTGVIGAHNVVLAYMPGMGTISAAAVAGSLRVSFPNITLALVVGICGGIPSGTDGEEIVLGDVIISQSLVQYDFGRQYPGGFKRKTDVRDTLGRPSPEIRALQAKLGTNRYRQRMQNNITIFLQEILQKLPKTKHPGQEHDVLYRSSYVHQHRSPEICDTCEKDDDICEVALRTDCEDLGCESSMRVTRDRLTGASTTQPVVHFGMIGSGNTVMKSGQHRDRVAQADGVIGFEMEGAGVWDYFPSIVIKGVCDYADSHKRKGWQRYAAATAAACMKALLVEWSVEEARISSDTEDLLSWISNTPYESDHSDVQVLTGTGKWLLMRETYVAWKKCQPPSIFLLHGMPGSGKTALLHTVVEDLKLAQVERGAMAYFYCKSASTEPQQVLRCLIRQLVSQASNFPTVARIVNELDQSQRQFHGQDPASPHGPLSLNNCVRLLSELTNAFSITTIIVDAVDECEDTDTLLNALDEVSEQSPKIKLFFTSREDSEIVQRYSQSPNLSISPQDNKADIEKFVRYRMTECIRTKKLLRGNVKDEFQEEIIEVLVSRADGMFLLPKLQLQALESRSKQGPRIIRPGDVRTMLSQLPNELTRLYDEFYDRIQIYMPETRDLTKRALQWLLCAQERLSMDCLLEAVSFQPTGSLAELNADELLIMCQHLISFSTQSNIVDFAHTTVREYLEKRFTQLEVEIMAAETCLSYLSVKFRGKTSLQTPTCKTSEFKRYSLLYWPAHVGRSGNPGFNESVSILVEKFIEKQEDGQDTLYARWMGEVRSIVQEPTNPGFMPQRQDWKETLQESFSPDANPIFGAYAFGFIDLVKKLTTCVGDNLLALENELGHDLMSITCGEGHIEVYKILFEEMPPWFYSAPFRVKDDFNQAALRNRLDMVKFLFEKYRSTLKESGLWSDSAMMTAAINRHDALLTFMVENGVASTDQFCYRTPLHVVASRGSEPLVKILLDHGAAIDAKLPDGMTALHMAATNGHATVVALLIARGADIMGKTTDGRTALHMAAGNGHLDIVTLLLAAEIDVMAQTTDGKTAFALAASNGHFRIVEAILRNTENKGDLPMSDVEELCENIIDPPMLPVTIFSSHRLLPETVMRPKANAFDPAELDDMSKAELWRYLQLREGSARNERQVEEWKKQLAEEERKRGEEAETRRLKRQEARMRRVGKIPVDAQGRTPLMLAALHGSEGISELLLAKYPETINVTDCYGFTALHYGAWQETTGVLQLLLDHGADATIAPNIYHTPLAAATDRRCAEGVRKLLEHLGEEAWKSPNIGVGVAWLKAHMKEDLEVKKVIAEVGLRFRKKLVWRESENTLSVEDVT